MSKKAELNLIAGAYYELEVTTKDSAGQTITIAPDTTDAIEWELSPNEYSTNVIVHKDLGSGIEILNGNFIVVINPADTDGLCGSYYHEASITISGKKQSVVYGAVTIQPSLL